MVSLCAEKSSAVLTSVMGKDLMNESGTGRLHSSFAASTCFSSSFSFSSPSSFLRPSNRAASSLSILFASSAEGLAMYVMTLLSTQYLSGISSSPYRLLRTYCLSKVFQSDSVQFSRAA